MDLIKLTILRAIFQVAPAIVSKNAKLHMGVPPMPTYIRLLSNAAHIQVVHIHTVTENQEPDVMLCQVYTFIKINCEKNAKVIIIG